MFGNNADANLALLQVRSVSIVLGLLNTATILFNRLIRSLLPRITGHP